jgi:integrase
LTWRLKTSGYWRTVPISPQLFELVEREIRPLTGDSEFVLPRVAGWDQGYAAANLRLFLQSIGITQYVVFHTLRACFATHLLAAGAEQAKIMKIGGWKDYKTFQIYVRLSGVEERGVTDRLEFLPSDEAVVARAGDIYQAALSDKISRPDDWREIS